MCTAPFRPRHWFAIARTFTTFKAPANALIRYISNRGRYPWTTTLRTPLGPIVVTLANSDDLLTINEVFCRRDYGSAARRTVVDIGANVGYTTLFFLTRSPHARVWAFEPDPANTQRLRETLRGFEGRFTLVEAAVVAVETKTMRFAPAGRYGHRAEADEPAIDVPALSLERALRDIAADVGRIDLVKIDTEGTEYELAQAMPIDVSVGEVRYEDQGHVVVMRPKESL